MSDNFRKSILNRFPSYRRPGHRGLTAREALNRDGDEQEDLEGGDTMSQLG
jgi:hypothetical protein